MRSRILVFAFIGITVGMVLARAAAAQSGGAAAQLRCSLSAEPDAVIGRSIGGEFGRVTGAAFVNDTVLAIADGLSFKLLFYSVSGRRLAQYGSEGEGPGAFRNLRRVFAKADTAVVYDASRSRASLFTLERGYIRALDVPRGLVALLSGDAKVTSANAAGTSRGRSGPEVWIDSLEIRIDNASGSRLLARITDRTRLIDVRTAMNIMDAPFTAIPAVDANSEQIVVADGKGQLRRIIPFGAGVTSVRSPFASMAITRADMSRWIEHSVNEARPEQQPARRTLLSVAPQPAVAPAHGNVVIDKSSRLWVEEYRAPYDVRPVGVAMLDYDDRLLLRATVPPRSRILAASANAAAFAVKDDLDVEAVALYDVRCT